MHEDIVIYLGCRSKVSQRHMKLMKIYFSRPVRVRQERMITSNKEYNINIDTCYVYIASMKNPIYIRHMVTSSITQHQTPDLSC